MKNESKKLLLGIFVLLAAGISPNIFVAAQAGYGQMSTLALDYLIPSIAVILAIIIITGFTGIKDFRRLVINGIIAGFTGTIGLEVVREIGFHLGGMPGDMPKLLGVLLLNRFALGPDTFSNIAGWSYHFWNGASFGIIYSVIFGRGKKWLGLIYALLIGTGFMVSPAAIALGVGPFGVYFGWGFPVTVLLAHVLFGIILGSFLYKKNSENTGLIYLFKTIRNDER